VIAFSAKGARLIEGAITIIGTIEERYATAIGSNALVTLKRQLGALLALHPALGAEGATT
jgi:hypothetical protein